MSGHDDEPTADEMDAEGDHMERRLDKLGDHVDDAKRKAEHTREHADLPGDEPVETVAGDAADRSTSSDDPTSAVGDPEKADD